MRSFLFLVAGLIGGVAATTGVAATAGFAATTGSAQTVQVYPNVPGEVVLENERVVVQRFITEPGQWQGVHTHPGNQVYIHVRGGEWTIRRGGQDTISPAETGSLGWWDRVDLSEQHDTANSGDTPIEHILVNLKPCGPLTSG